jgi:energy-converting hydrogenase Eha subunit G
MLALDYDAVLPNKVLMLAFDSDDAYLTKSLCVSGMIVYLAKSLCVSGMIVYLAKSLCVSGMIVYLAKSLCVSGMIVYLAKSLCVSGMIIRFSFNAISPVSQTMFSKSLAEKQNMKN